MIIDDSVITCDEIIDAEAKRVPTNFNEKNYNWLNTKFIYRTCLFINYHCIIDSCQYLFSSDKIFDISDKYFDDDKDFDFNRQKNICKYFSL